MRILITFRTAFSIFRTQISTHPTTLHNKLRRSWIKITKTFIVLALNSSSRQLCFRRERISHSLRRSRRICWMLSSLISSQSLLFLLVVRLLLMEKRKDQLHKPLLHHLNSTRDQLRMALHWIRCFTLSSRCLLIKSSSSRVPLTANRALKWWAIFKRIKVTALRLLMRYRNSKSLKSKKEKS